MGGGPTALAQASKNPTLQDVAQRLPILTLLQRNGFCGQVDNYLTPTASTSASGGGDAGQLAYVARVVVNANLTLYNMPVSVVGMQQATPPNGGSSGLPSSSSSSTSSVALTAPLFGYAYATQEVLGSTAGVCAVTVDVWQQCAAACAQALGCVGWTHYTKVCVWPGGGGGLWVCLCVLSTT